MTSEAPRHRIGRQVVEVTLGDASAEPDLHRRVQRWAERSLPSVLERLCGDLDGASHAVQRWDRVDVDLGSVPWEGFEQALTTGLRQRLPDVLRRQLADVQPSPQRGERASTAGQGASRVDPKEAAGGSELELIDCFVQTGTVPWWAESRRADLLTAALDRVLAQRGDRQVDACVQRWVAHEAPLRRLILHLDEPRLGALLSRLLRAMGRSLGDGDRRPELWVWALSRAHEAMDSPQAPPVDDLTFRRAVWTSLFLAVRGAPASARSTAAGRRHSAKDAVWDDVLHRLTGGLQLRGEAIADWAQALAAVLAGPARRAGSSLDGAAAPWIQPLKRLKNLWSASSSAASRDRAATQIHAERAAGDLTPVHSTSGGDLSARSLTGPSADDAIYIDHAGLILLWPFLGSLFEHLGWLQGQAFAERISAYRAVALTHYLAVGEPELAEYQVLLNKILCGVDLDDVLDIGPPLRPEEMAAARGLLDAALGHGPLWKTLSHDGLRRAFLQRSGALSVRDDHWLLRVERQTHDVIIDRLPWSWQWVRLPWMLGALQVEW